MPAEILNRIAAKLPTIKGSKTDLKEPFKNTVSPTMDFKRWKFALSLPIIDANTLPRNLTCPQCEEPYNTMFMVAGSKSKLGHEVPAVLPCLCVIGFYCAREWFSPFEFGHKKCPLCHTAFPELADEPEVDSRINADFAWLNTEIKSGGSPSAKDQADTILISEGTDETPKIEEEEDFSWLISIINAGELVTNIEGVKGEEKMVPQKSHGGFGSSAPDHIVGQLPSIDEVLSLYSSDTNTIHQEKPLIVVTTPEGKSSDGHEATSMKHLSNADTASLFSRRD